jgi:hypothetical protein
LILSRGRPKPESPLVVLIRAPLRSFINLLCSQRASLLAVPRLDGANVFCLEAVHAGMLYRPVMRDAFADFDWENVWRAQK